MGLTVISSSAKWTSCVNVSNPLNAPHIDFDVRRAYFVSDDDMFR